MRRYRFLIAFSALCLLLAPIAPVVAQAGPAAPSFGPTGLDGGGLINVVAIDPWNPGVVIAGGDVSGIHRSTDDGQSWSTANVGIDTLSQLQVASIAFSPTTTDEIYAAVGFKGQGGGLLVSLDDGRTWTLRSAVPQFSGSTNPGVAGLPSQHPRSTGTLIQIDGAGGLLYVATFAGGVMRSVDDGKTWTTLGLAGEHLRSLELEPADPHVLFASTYGDGVWETTTASTTGTFSKLAGSPTTAEDLAFVGSDLYAVGPDGLFRSPDAGATWVQVGAGQLPPGKVAGSSLDTPTWFTVTGYQACGKTVLYVGGQGKGGNSVMTSTDAGATWASLVGDPSAIHPTEGGPGGPQWWLAGNSLAALAGANYLVTQIAVDPGSAPNGCARQRVLVAGRAGVFGTIDAGANWYPMVRGLGVTVVRGVATDPNVVGRAYLALADWTFASSTDGGATVSQNAPATVHDAFGVAVDPSTTPSTVYLATGRLSGSPAGEIWSNPAPASGTPWTNEGLYLAAGGARPVGLAVNEVGGSPVILAAVQGLGLWRKASGTWSQDALVHVGGSPVSFSWVPGSALVYLYDPTTGVWRSNDAGVSWTEIWHQPSLDDMTAYVTADPRDPTRLYVSVANLGLYRLDGADVGTVEGGQIVPQEVGGFAAPGAIALRSDGAIYAVELPTAPDGPSVWFSPNEGANWSKVSDAAYAATGGFVRTLSVGPESTLWAGLYGEAMTVGSAPIYDLTVSPAGTGSGSVASSPTGINCGTTCSATFDWGTPVTLTATPYASSVFSGWSGAGCAGTGTCRVTMSQAASVTATFALSYRPDGLLATGKGAFVGDGVYNATGASQTVSVSEPRGQTAVFRWQIQNDGTLADHFACVGPASSSHFAVAYFLGTSNVTGAVTNGTYVKQFGPGGSLTITVKVTVAANATLGSVRSLKLTAASKSVTLADVVLAKVKAVR